MRFSIICHKERCTFGKDGLSKTHFDKKRLHGRDFDGVALLIATGRFRDDWDVIF
jgi:hypothetical protein